MLNSLKQPFYDKQIENLYMLLTAILFKKIILLTFDSI